MRLIILSPLRDRMRQISYHGNHFEDRDGITPEVESGNHYRPRHESELCERPLSDHFALKIDSDRCHEPGL